MTLRRLPLASLQPAVAFALARVALSALAFVLLLFLDVPDRGAMLAVLGGGALPWSLALLALSARRPDALVHPLVAIGDLAVLLVLDLAAPSSYGVARSAALFFITVHAHFQGEARGVAIAAVGAAALIGGHAAVHDGPESGSLLAFYDAIFAAAAIAGALLVGRLRTTESAFRLRARQLSRRSMQAESEVRRQVAEVLHDGPVQELIGLDMVLAAVRQASDGGDGDGAGKLIEEAREIVGRNIQILRDEIVSLGPYAFEELSFSVAVENCMPVWKRRYGFQVLASIEEIDLRPEIAGDLFRITQEAVANAGRHAEATTVSLSLRTLGEEVELRVMDDGKGFGDADPFETLAPGHLGLASMRERTELMNGRLELESSSRGTKLVVRAPLSPNGGAVAGAP